MGRWLYRPSLLVAIAMMLALPFATLEVPDVVAECCCPSPEVCKCPDHRGEQADHTAMRSCHRTSHHLAISKLSQFAAPPSASAPVLPVPTLVALAAPPAPHAAPWSRPPDVPS